VRENCEKKCDSEWNRTAEKSEATFTNTPDAPSPMLAAVVAAVRRLERLAGYGP
jgi:hypothetical protein